MKAFIFIKTDPGLHRRIESKPGVFVNFAHNLQPVYVGIPYRKDYGKWYSNNSAWCLGFFFIKNPLYETMKLNDLKKLLKKILLQLDFDKEGKKYFEGNCEDLMGKLTKFMDRLIAILNVQNKEQSKKWSYEEDPYTRNPLKKRLKLLDNFMKNLKNSEYQNKKPELNDE